jgi:hypothetical protein
VSISRLGRGRVLGPLQVPDGLVTLRTPRLRDAEAWSAARLANRQWLERAYPAWGGDWTAEQQPTAWVERWWRLRRLAWRGLARPYVVELNGRLIGELGIDAIDELTWSGEASSWAVRDHGSSAVMHAASQLLLVDSFTGRRPMDRVLSPVAITGRRGRTPSLTSLGLRIEATIPRRVGDKGLVDHDMWIIHNTTEARRALKEQTEAVAHAPVNPAHVSFNRWVIAAAVARAAVRGVRDALRATRTPNAEWLPPAAIGEVGLRLERRQDSNLREFLSDRRASRAGSLVPWVIVHNGRAVGSVRIMIDVGTGISELLIGTEPGVERSVLASALTLALGAMTARGLAIAVRVPTLTNTRRQQPDADMLTDAGLVLVATFAGNPETRYDWAGEQRWEFPQRP